MNGEAARDDPWALQSFRIVDKVQESADVYSFELEGQAGFPFRPGQFNMLYAFGKGEVPISISGGGGGSLHHTIRDVGRITAELCRREPGELIELRGPYGSAWPIAEAEGLDVIVVAGGIGLAPVRPVIRSILANREAYGRFALLYGARTPDDLIFDAELESYADRDDVDYHVTVDIAPRGWPGAVGVVTELFERLSVRGDRTIAMTCGPEIMMRFTAETLRDLGVPDERIYLSMERNMKCAIGFCGHCQYGPHFICRHGAVLGYDQLRDLLMIREL